MSRLENIFGSNRPGTAIGITLLDTLLVVLIIGILAMTTMPRFAAVVSEAKLNGAATELVMALEYAKSLAVRYRKPFDVEAFRHDYSDPRANQFSVRDIQYVGDSRIHLDAAPPVYNYGRVFNPVDKTPYIIDFNNVQATLAGVVTPQRQYDGVDIVAVPGGGSQGVIQFYPDGHCSDPAASANTYVLNYAGNQKTITVEGATGRITIR